jgi:hypothetical protein
MAFTATLSTFLHQRFYLSDLSFDYYPVFVVLIVNKNPKFLSIYAADQYAYRDLFTGIALQG